MRYNIGERVKIDPCLLSKKIYGFDVYSELLDIPATVISYNSSYDFYVIEFDEDMGGHGCDGLTLNRRGLYVGEQNIIPYFDDGSNGFESIDLMEVLVNG